MTAICAVDAQGQRLWRDQCGSTPELIEAAVRRRADADARLGIETGPMTPWLIHELRARGFEIVWTPLSLGVGLQGFRLVDPVRGFMLLSVIGTMVVT
jgi:hypothetical protein